MDCVLELKDIVKVYPGVTALNHVTMSFKNGEVHAIVGENGAGKSTLIKTIAGAIAPDGGELVIAGKKFDKLSPKLAKECGVEVIYQEFNLIDSLSAAENIFLGEKSGRFVNYKKLEKKAQEIFDKLGVKINPKSIVRELAPAQMQIVEIAKAITKDVKILIMDEPTAPLSVSEVEKLFEIVRSMKEKGITIIYISHRLEEIFSISDRVSILRDGEYICTKNTAETNRQELISLMVGREIKNIYNKKDISTDEIALEVRNYSGKGVDDVSFSLKKGEILGISGLVGAGRTELVRLIFGADKKSSGKLFKYGKEIIIKSPKAAFENGIGLIPEDRKHDGLFLNMEVSWNISITIIKELCNNFVIKKPKEKELGDEYVNSLNIKTPSLKQKVGFLSGGNQQKVVLAKVLAADSDILIFDEPTRGIDIGARQEIYALMEDLTKKGKSIIMISSDMEELLGMSDRILVIREGALSGEVNKKEFSQERILELASV